MSSTRRCHFVPHPQWIKVPFVYTVASIWHYQIFAVLKYVVVTYFCFHDSVRFVDGSSSLIT